MKSTFVILLLVGELEEAPENGVVDEGAKRIANQRDDEHARRPAPNHL